MRFTQHQGDADLKALATRVYGRLSKDRMKAAEKALLQANPQLATIGDVRRGTLLVVPTLTEVDTTSADRGSGLSEPVRDLLVALGKERQRLSTAAANDRSAAEETLATFQSAPFQEVVKRYPDLVPHVTRVEQASKARQAEADALQAFTDTELVALEKDLAELVARLG